MTREELQQSIEYKVTRAAAEYYEKHKTGDTMSAFEAGAEFVLEMLKEKGIEL